MKIGTLLFEGFELLDTFGPLEMFGLLPEHFSIIMLAEQAGEVKSGQGPVAFADYSLMDSPEIDILLVPGGMGTRREVENKVLLQWLAEQAGKADYVCSVCTGSALLAKSGVLDGLRATSNKGAFQWVTEQSDKVNWVTEARWVQDGNTFTSSGVSAGIDMSLAVIAEILGEAQADEVAMWSEYDWHKDPDWDPFAKIRGLID